MGRHFFNFLARIKTTRDDDGSLQQPDELTSKKEDDPVVQDEYEDANSELDDDECVDNEVTSKKEDDPAVQELLSNAKAFCEELL